MIIDELSNKKILLLQGPIGYFFRNLARDLKAVNASEKHFRCNLLKFI